ncbi:hypothetical protein U8P76_23645 [Rhizobium johnstonii]|nr:hypothetical protein U8P76_23645 [Rhizobium johnstonii]
MDSQPSKANVVYFIHGIRTYANWIRRFRADLKSKGVECGARSYGRFPLFKFLFPGAYLQDILKMLRSDLNAYEQQGKTVTVVAHSFGAYLIYRLLRDDQSIRIHRLVLCGAVIQRRARWIDLKLHRKQIDEQIVNLCGVSDPFPPLSELACRRFGASGVAGAGDPSVDDYYFDVGHSGFFTEEFYRKYFEDAILRGEVKGAVDADYTRTVSALLYLGSHKTVLKIASASFVVLIAATLWIRPEFLCSVLKCEMNVYRQDDLSGSFKRGDVRAYSRVIQTSYQFNYLPSGPYIAKTTIPAGEIHPDVFALDDRNAKKKVEGDQDPAASTNVVKLKSSDEGATKVPADGHLFKIPVRWYRADAIFEYRNENAQPNSGPAASSFNGRQTLENLEVEIRLPEGVSLLPCNGNTYASGILPAKYADRKFCVVSKAGQVLTCSNLALQPETNIFYQFRVNGWDAESDKAQCDLSE